MTDEQMSKELKVLQTKVEKLESLLEKTIQIYGESLAELHSKLNSNGADPIPVWVMTNKIYGESSK